MVEMEIPSASPRRRLHDRKQTPPNQLGIRQDEQRILKALLELAQKGCKGMHVCSSIGWC
jgi:hypothetical protein